MQNEGVPQEQEGNQYENLEERVELRDVGGAAKRIFFDGQDIGPVALADHGDYYSVGFVTIPEEHRGKGIGTIVYKKLAATLDKPLRSDAWISEPAEQLWQKFERKGLAERIDTAVNGRGVYEWRG